MKIVIVFPPAKVSNEVDTFKMISDATVSTVGSTATRRPVDLILPSFSLPYFGAYERWSAGLAWYRSLSPLIDAIRNADVVVTYEIGTVTTSQVRKIAGAVGTPHVAIAAQTIIGYPVFRFPPWRGFLKRNVPKLAGVLCLNERSANCARSFGVPNDRVHVTHFGIDTELYYPAQSRPDQPVITFLGDLRPEKGIIDAIAAAEIAEKRVGPEFELRVVGDGPLMPKVRLAAETRPWLKIMGRVQRDKVPEILRESCALMTASWSRAISEEQFGFALVEGMACGLPIVSTTSGAIPQVVPSNNFLAPEHDIDGLADGIVRSLSPAADGVGASNRKYAVTHFDLRRNAEELRSVLQGIINSTL